MTKFERCLAALSAAFLLLLGAVTIRESRGLPLEETAPPARGLAAPSYRLDINRADAENLCALPGIGETVAQRIIAYREAHGPFASLEDLMLVEGIGEKTMENIYAYLEED